MSRRIVTEAERKKIMSKPHVKFTDMTAEVSGEAQEVVTMAMDKYISTQNWEAAAKLVKETMDKKFGGPWHCLIGEGADEFHEPCALRPCDLTCLLTTRCWLRCYLPATSHPTRVLRLFCGPGLQALVGYQGGTKGDRFNRGPHVYYNISYH